jgi:hypothetical protein
MRNSFQKVNKKSFTGLKYIVYINRICSVTYFGVQFNKVKGNKSNVKKILLISWSLLFMAISVYNCYHKLNRSIKTMVKEWSSYSSKSLVLNLVMAFGSIGYHIQSLVIQILLLLRGNKIINLINSQNLEYIEERNERRIGIFIALAQFLISITLEILIETIIGIFYTPKNEINIKECITDSVLYVLIFSSQLSITTLIAYQSLIVSQQLENISKIFLKTNILIIYQFINKTNALIHELDELVSHFNSITIFYTIIISIQCASILGIDPKKFLSFSLPFITESLILLITLCLSCDIIPKNFEKFCYKLEKHVSENSKENDILVQMNQNILLMKINTIKHEIGFTASNLFKINTNTIISILALILSYSVLLIQTSNEN